MDRRRRCFTLMEEQEDTPPLGQSYCHTVYISMQILFSSTWDAVAMTEWHLSLGNIIIIKAEDHQEEQSLGKVDFHSVVPPFSGGLIYKPRSQMITQLSKKVPQMQSHREECLSTWTCPSKQQLLMPITASISFVMGFQTCAVFSDSVGDDGWWMRSEFPAYPLWLLASRFGRVL